MRKLVILFFIVFVQQTCFSQFLKDHRSVKAYDGYFNFYYDRGKDKVYLEIQKLEKEFLYVNSLSEGVGSNDIGLDRGKLGAGVVVFFRKAGNKILLIQPNLKYRALTENTEEKKSITEAFAKSVLHGFVIEEEKNGVYLVDATPFFIQDTFGVANILAVNGEGNYAIDRSRCAFNLSRTKAFEKNVEFDVMLTFKGDPKGMHLSSVVPNANAVTIFQHHSFVALPDDQYKPRAFDPRAGGYPMSFMDYASPVNESNVKRYIYRHRLEKKNPNAAMSEAVEPIVYYLDRGTPEPIRSALLDGARWWNQAFEAIGYRDAFQVKMLPKDADPLDLRYNVIQWVHRSTRGWSYGGSISDPRTGEIIKGHVSLGSLRIRQDFLIAQALQAPYATATAQDTFALEMALDRIRQLSAHEVGHTLGFAHNFAASTNNRASVMDYPHPKFSMKDGVVDFSNAYATGIGAWDKVAVAYAYQQFNANEPQELQKILTTAFSKGLRYLSDQDARPLGSAHAYAHLWDNGKSASDELKLVLEIRQKSISKFSPDHIKSGQPYSVLEDVFVPLYFMHRYQLEAVSKVIGGLDYNYAVKGGGQTIVERVSGAEERRALEVMLTSIAVETLAIPTEKLQLFPPRALGYPRTRESFKSKIGSEFDPYGAVETASDFALRLLLHPQRAARLILHKSLDASQLGLVELIDEVIGNTFKVAHENSYNQELQHVINRQVLSHLFSLAAQQSSYRQVQAIVHYKLDELASWLRSQKYAGTQHMYTLDILKSIHDFKKSPQQYKQIKSPKIPDGSPIGME